jgi:hypothetical protein
VVHPTHAVSTALRTFAPKDPFLAEWGMRFLVGIFEANTEVQETPDAGLPAGVDASLVDVLDGARELTRQEPHGELIRALGAHVAYAEQRLMRNDAAVARAQLEDW